MQNKIFWIGLVLVLTSSLKVNAQYSLQDSTSKRYFIGSTLFVLGNFAATNKPDFAQLNFGYRLTENDVVSVELKTWKYAWSLGIPYGASYEAIEEKH